jgi:hypothetical protein
VRTDGLGGAEREAEVAGVIDAFEKEEQWSARYRKRVEDARQLVEARARFLGRDRDNAAVRRAVSEGVEFGGSDASDWDTERGGGIEDVLNLLRVRAVADQDDLEAPLASGQSGEYGLASF